MRIDRAREEGGTFEVVDRRSGSVYKVECSEKTLDLLSLLVRSGRYIVRRVPRGVAERVSELRRMPNLASG